MNQVRLGWMAAVLALGCKGDESLDSDHAHDSDSDVNEVVDLTDDVAGLVVRQLKSDVALTDFEAARDAYVAALQAQPGIGTDREFAAFLDFSTFGAPDPQVFIGLTQGDSLPEFSAAADAVGATEAAATFFGTFDVVSFGLLTPLEGGEEVDIAQIASAPQHILEVAVRDLSTYENFDAAAYEAARDAFLPLLAAQPGVIAEYQWVSPADPNLAVGMTVYEDQDAYFAVATDEALVSSEEYAAFVFGYPFVAGFAASVVK